MGSFRLFKIALASALLTVTMIIPTMGSPSAAIINISPPTPPTISVSVVSDLVYSDGLTFEVTINRNGATISDWNLEYSLDNQATWIKKKGPAIENSGDLVKYRIAVSGLQPGQTVHYRAYLTYSSGTKTITTAVFNTQTDILPAVTIFIEGYDSEYVGFNCIWFPNNNTLLKYYSEYRINGGDWVTIEASPGSLIKTYSLDPGTTFQMRGRTLYEKSGGATDEVTSEIYTVKTNELPYITLTILAIDYESVTVQADCFNNNNAIDDYQILYKIHDDLFHIQLNETNRIGTNRYKAVISGLPPEDFLQVSYQIDYQATTYRESSDRSIQGTNVPVWTNKRPELLINIANIDFDSITFDVVINDNFNNVAGSMLEHRFATSQPWLQKTNTGSTSWSSTISNITDNYISYRGSLTCQTAVALRKIDLAEKMVQRYKLSTDEWFYWYYNKLSNRGDLEIFGNIYAPKVNAEDISYLDKGFIWSESSNPVINGSVNQISLGNAALPDQTIRFKTTIANLATGKSIYYRAYAIGEKGNIIYGNTMRFNTFASPANIYTPTPSPGPGQPTPSTTPTATSNETTPSATESSIPEISPTSGAVSPTPVMTQTISSDTNSATSTNTDTATTNSSESTTSDAQSGNDEPGPLFSMIWILVIAGITLSAAAGIGLFIYFKARPHA